MHFLIVIFLFHVCKNLRQYNLMSIHYFDEFFIYFFVEKIILTIDFF